MSRVASERAERALVLLGRSLRLLAVWCAAASVIVATSAFVFWDVDPYEARKRYERWRDAWFSREGSAASVSERGTRFITREADGISWHTGVATRGSLEYRHCYARKEGGDAGQPDRSVQAAQGGGVAGSSPLVIWNDITHEQSGIFGKSPAAFIAAAKRGCVFEGGEDAQS